MKTLYLDIFSGISGDMFIGALIDLGVDAHKLERELAKLKLDGYHLHIGRQERQGIAGVKFDVHLAHEHEHDHDQHHPHHYPAPEHERCDGGEGCHQHLHEHGGHEHSHGQHEHEHEHEHHHDDSRNFAEIKKLIGKSKLSPWVKKKAVAVFQRIAEAEGKIHGMPPAKVHFHEVGAVDSIVDIVGGCIGLELLGKPRVLAAPVTEGVGWVSCAHGRFPIPAPATLAILGARGIGVTQCDEPHELVTPTGAALLAELVEEFGPMSGIVAGKIGFGLGTRENKTRPNVLRAVLGRTGVALVSNSRSSGRSKLETGATPVLRSLDWETDRIAVLETNLDDISGEVLGDFVERALAAGALDVFHTPIQMKKNRPGVLLTVLCAEGEADKFSEMILRETSAFGVRRTMAERRKLRREFKTVKTKFGNVSVKLGTLNGETVQAAPEYESCRKLATQKKVSLRQIYAAAAKGIGK
ncbi:MAG: nickel pincer cofactor biosynthesis protein LarC [Verrucomicrobia bacterium]|nr:nickel pincer cofactor biosynthesis protein LarC [Verrucomicrobiota bacterium]